jgi:hypothetical protein
MNVQPNKAAAAIAGKRKQLIYARRLIALVWQAPILVSYRLLNANEFSGFPVSGACGSLCT